MSQQSHRIKFLLYIRTSGCPKSKKCHKLWESIADERVRLCIKIQDAEKVTQVLRKKGKSNPSWLTGTPTLATADAKPTVWKGVNALEQMENIVVHANRQYQGEASYSGKVSGPAHVGTSNDQGIVDGAGTMSQTTDSEYGRGAAVVNDDLYFSKRVPPSGGGGGGGGKISSSDIADFYRRAEESAPRRLKESMGASHF